MNENEAVGRTLAPHRTPEFQAYMAALFNDLVWWRGRQLTTGQTTQPDPPARMLRYVAACRCEYIRHYARIPIGGRQVVRSRTIVVATGFQIDSGCPHHGDRLEVWDHEPQFWDTLTDDSERGHDADQT